MSLAEYLDAAILVLLLIWFTMDRFNIYFRRPPS